MGNIIGRLFQDVPKEARLLVVGLDGVGKTTILYRLRLGEIVTTIPTIGFDVETVRYKNLTFNMWDIGGQENIRRLWHFYYEQTKGIVYVIDSSDRERITETRTELHGMLAHRDLDSVALLVFANKQDVPGAMSAEEVSEALELERICAHRPWHVQATSAISASGAGLYEGFDWLSSVILRRIAEEASSDSDVDD